MPDLVLRGCRPVPLAHYLKALGVLRLVAEQKDPSARGAWQRERFVLRTELDREELERFFLVQYRPTPIVAPWNGGSGFYPKDNQKALEALVASPASRFAEYRETIAQAKAILAELGIADKEGGDTKATLLERCRATFPDHSLQWLDATYVLSAEGPKYPPLLGTGGNDGRLDFTNNFMQRLVWLLDETTGEPRPAAKGLLKAALFEMPTNELLKGAPIGQFLPSHAGGANAGSGFGSDSLINPWDFVLMLEGATVFATATVRRTEREIGGALSYPFTVHTVGVGYASAAKEDESSARAEMWLPLWNRPATARETLALLAEGRARVGRRTARNGVDFARAVAGLGVDRGIEAFQRYGFQVRNGLAYFAVPLGRFTVKAEPRAALLDEIDGWLESFRMKANGQTAPASAVRVLRQLETAVLELCTHGDNLRLQQVLIALGRAEQVMATSARWTAESYLQPVPPLRPDWLEQIGDGSPELRLAAALASVHGYYGPSDTKGTFLPLRRQLEAVQTWKTDAGLRARWDAGAGRDVAWTAGHLVGAMNSVLMRRLVLAVQAGATTYPDRGYLTASLGDIADFIEGRVDDQRLSDLLWGVTLLDWSQTTAKYFPARRARPRTPLPGAFYSLLKLCFAGPSVRVRSKEAFHPRDGEQQVSNVPLVLQIHRLAAAGHGAEASTEAIRRLRGSGIAPAVTPFQVTGAIAVRTAAALLFPISAADREMLIGRIARPEKAEPDAEPDPTTTQSGVIA
jgi:CRISPR-associated protein Csx17